MKKGNTTTKKEEKKINRKQIIYHIHRKELRYDNDVSLLQGCKYFTYHGMNV